ncbi:MAG: hypothetical protein AB7E76_06120 [Deferribacterales bacterium]
MMWKKYFRSYKLLLVLSVVLSLLIVEFIALTSATVNIETATRDANAQLKRLRIENTNSNMDKLDHLVDEMHIPQFNAVTARSWLLEVTEDFKSLYDTKIIKPITNEGSSYTTTISFSYQPGKPDDFIRMIEYLENSVSPIYKVTQMDFKETRGARVVSVELIITQPYRGGVYDY